MTPHTITRNSQLATRNTRSWSLIVLLLLLFVGPLIAPLFQATGLPFAADSGALARDLLSRYVCPTPAKSYALLGFPMAVCARCWGARIGLWGAWLLSKSQVAGSRSRSHQNQEPLRRSLGQARTENYPSNDPRFLVFGSWFFHQPWLLRLCLALGAVVLWSLELNTWPTAPLSVLLLDGANGGFWAGMLVGSLWLARHSALTHRVDATRSQASNW